MRTKNLITPGEILFCFTLETAEFKAVSNFFADGLLFFFIQAVESFEDSFMFFCQLIKICVDNLICFFFALLKASLLLL